MKSYQDSAILLNKDTRLRYKISRAQKFGKTNTITPNLTSSN